jgi:hypothetical protein
MTDMYMTDDQFYTQHWSPRLCKDQKIVGGLTDNK